MNMLATTTSISFKNILFLTDLTGASEAALLYALAFACHYSAQIYPAHVVVPSPLEQEQSSRLQSAEADQQQRLQQLTALVKNSSVKYQPLSCIDAVRNAVPRWIAEHEIDLIVVGTHGRRGVQRFLLGSTAEMILRTATCPVLTVGPHVIHRLDTAPAIRKVLFATGMTTPSSLAIRYALSFVREEQTHLTVLRVMPENTSRYNPARQRALAGNQLRRLIPFDAEVWREPELIVEEGDAEKHILDWAQKELPDLIVLALPSNDGFSTLDAGVMYKIVAASPSAVLTVPGRL
jgi:nucleotide-binding universal stress UspA family protein